MKIRIHDARLRALTLLLALGAGLVLFGCDAELTQSAELSPATRGALDVLPADARMAAAFDLEAARDNAFAADLLERERVLPRSGGEAYDRIREFLDVTGFDPKQDLQRLYVAAVPGDEKGSFGLVAYADFDRDRMQTYFEEHQVQRFVRSDYGGTPVYRQESDNGRALTLALPNEEMLLAASSESVLHAMLDNLGGSGRGLSSNTGLMALIDRVPREGGWMVVHEPFAEPPSPADGGEMSRLAPMIQDMILASEFRDGGIHFDVVLDTKPAYEADDVADVMRGMVGTARGAAKQADDGDALDLLDRVEIRDREGEVRASLFLDDRALDRLRSRS